MRIADSNRETPAATQIPLTTSTGFSPRLGANYLLYVSATGTSESIWKLVNDRLLGAATGQAILYVMQADGTNARIVADSLNLQGAPAWEPDGQSITSAVEDHGVPHLCEWWLARAIRMGVLG
jgi:hypothetical protein